jgi:hypothetical protein
MKKILLAVFLAFTGIIYSQTCNLSFDVVDLYNQYQLNYTGKYITSGSLNLQVVPLTANSSYYYKITKNGQSTIQTSPTFQVVFGSYSTSFDVQVSIGHPDTAKCKGSKYFSFSQFNEVINSDITRSDNTLRLTWFPQSMPSIYLFKNIPPTYQWYKGFNTLWSSSDITHELQGNSIDDGTYSVHIIFDPTLSHPNMNSSVYFLRISFVSKDYIVKTVTAVEDDVVHEKTLLKTFNLKGQEILNGSKGVQIRVFSDGSREKVFVE